MSPRLRSALQHPGMLPPTYEAHLPRFDSQHLKRLARLWVGKDANRMNKEACAAAIVKALADPASLRALGERLSEFERAGLGLLKLRGPIASTEEVALELLMLGLPFRGRTSGYRHWYGTENHYEALNSLLGKGLLLLHERDSGHSYRTSPEVSEYHNRPQVFADPRLLAHIEVVPPAPLEMSPIAGVEAGLYTRPAEVVRHCVMVVEALRRVGRLELTVKGRVSKPFLARLARTLGWGERLATESATPLPDAPLFFLKLLESAGLLAGVPHPSSSVLAPDVASFFELPYEAQAEVWVRAYRSISGWLEHKPSEVWESPEEAAQLGKFNGIRAALLVALGALPDPIAWYRIRDLSEAMYSRIGECFALGYLHRFYPPFQATPAQLNQKRREWQQELHQKWTTNEAQWIVHAVAGPLFHLGLVELAAEPGAKPSDRAFFRLTELGRGALYDSFRSAPHGSSRARSDRPPTPEGRCWVVQPNFDVVVYLDRISASRLTFIERIAERKPSQGATALYRLTREMVYAALESGIEPGILLETLARGSEYPLPENVRQTLDDWASRRERLTVYRVAHVLEFTAREARDAALARGDVAGVPVGDRFLMLSAGKIPPGITGDLRRTIDYRKPGVRCIHVTEDGSMTLDPTGADLLVRGEMAGWSEPDSTDGSRWRITRSSVQRAVSSGWTAERIIDGLSRRAQYDIPPLLLVAIRAWAGTRLPPTSVAVASDLILQVMSEEVAMAIAASDMLQPYLRGALGPRTFLVRHETAQELCSRLAAFGLHVGSDLALELLYHAPGEGREAATGGVGGRR